MQRVESDLETKVEAVLADAAYINGENLVAAEELNIDLIGPLPEPKGTDNPAVREDLTQPVAEQDVSKLPTNPQTKRFSKLALSTIPRQTCITVLKASRCNRLGQVPERVTTNKSNKSHSAVPIVLAVYGPTDVAKTRKPQVAAR